FVFRARDTNRGCACYTVHYLWTSDIGLRTSDFGQLAMSSAAAMQERVSQFRQAYNRVMGEIGKVIVGHTEIVHGVLTCLFVGGTLHRLKEPFFVMATQNPLEQEGTYPLPEAQLDRFFFKLMLNYSGRDEMATILDRTTKGEWPKAAKVMDGDEIGQWQQLV